MAEMVVNPTSFQINRQLLLGTAAKVSRSSFGTTDKRRQSFLFVSVSIHPMWHFDGSNVRPGSYPRNRSIPCYRRQAQGGGLLACTNVQHPANPLDTPTAGEIRCIIHISSQRAFESFSEDPHHSGTLAAACVDGLQKNGVAATIKHFVCYDQEHQRTAASSEASDRALREIYLMPFMIAQKDAQPLEYMARYGRMNGTHVSESPWLIGDEGILQKECGLKGLVMSDWNGTYGVDLPIKAGIDLEMPGLPKMADSLADEPGIGLPKVTLSDIEKEQRMSSNSPSVWPGYSPNGLRGWC
ncbi:glycoside hydrolase family 3 protein [Tulasnella calospora MUT 4182]|uniref:beta-glucosidase n=1 Tax=Tulasnella calospora MUT 4182 TaxID=1051891 RepID=A0A0C3LF13_9AGAM|nr:glycoside hydrolase family 3 protein [Tulasnella calospora MUT 4182]